MRQLLRWIEDRRVIAAFVRATAYIAVILLLPKPSGHEKDYLRSMIAGAYAADFSTWFVFSALTISTRYKAACLKALPNLAAGMVIYSYSPSLADESIDLAMSFVPFMAVLLSKSIYYTYTFDGSFDDDEEDDSHDNSF